MAVMHEPPGGIDLDALEHHLGFQWSGLLVIQLDLNNPELQTNLLALGKQEARAVLKTLPILQVMSWEQLQSSKGLRRELIQSRQAPGGSGSTSDA